MLTYLLVSHFFYVVLCLNIALAVGLFLVADHFLKARLRIGNSLRIDHFRISEALFSKLSVVKEPTELFANAFRILICWLPYLALLYPCLMYWDTGDQLAQFFGVSAFGMPAGQIWDHHPWFSTYLYGAITQLGHYLTGFYLFGLFLNASIQYIIVTILFSWTISILYSRGLSKRALGYISMFMRFFPPFPILCASMSKDVTNAIALYCWLILYFKIANKELDGKSGIALLCLFIVDSFVVALSKKMGMYIELAALIVLLFFNHSLKFKVSLIAGCASMVLIVNTLLPNYMYPALNIVKGGAQAAIVMPIELLGRVAHYYPNDITEGEEDVIDSYLAYTWNEMGANYNPYIADPVTGHTLKGDVSFASFLKVWFIIGLRHPMSYMNAFFSLESGWISFAGSPTVAAQTKSYLQVPLLLEPVFYASYNPDTFGKLQTCQEESWGQKIVEHVYKWVSRMPGLNVFCYVAMWTSVVPAFVLFEYLRASRRDMLFALVPYLISAMSLFVYPVSLSAQRQDPTRYMFHMLLMAPFLIGLAFLAAQRGQGVGAARDSVSDD